jgi:hypothetical protein
MAIESVTSAHWENIFDNSPIEFNDTEEYEYTEFLEAQGGGEDIGVNQNIFRLYNRDVDPYYYFHKAFIRIRGFTSLATGANQFSASNLAFYGTDTDKAALCNLGQFRLFTKAELKIESTMISKVDNPGMVTLTKLLTRLCNDNLDSQGGLFFFYKDTGYGEANVYKYAHIKMDPDAAAVDFSSTLNTGSSKGLQIYDNPNFNNGFLKRWKLCRNQGGQFAKEVELIIPLSYLFDFYDSCRFPFRGTKHEITLYKDANSNNYIHKGAGGENGTNNQPHMFNLKKMSLFVPRLKPSLTRMSELDAKLASGATQLLAWKDSDYYQSPQIAQTTTTYNWRVTAMQSRPSMIYVFYQKASRTDGDQAWNKMIYDTLNLRTLEIRVNGHIFPQETLILKQGLSNANAPEPDYMRAYLMLLESQNKMLVDDTGMLISYEEFNKIYNLFVFDLTKMERRVYESISASEIEIRWTLDANAPDNYYCFTIIESDKRATLQGSNNKMLITL